MKGHLVLLCALLAAPACFGASTNRLQAVDHASAPAVATNDAVELEFQKLMADDDAALTQIDLWIRNNQKFADQGAGVPKGELTHRILKRVEPVRAAYDDFLKRHPGHGRARLAYASLLEDVGEPEAALEQMLKAKEVEPANPAAWNNLANYYGHNGPVTNAFAHYEKAIALDAKESVYYHNFGTTVFLFRTDAKAYYHLNEQQVFDKSLQLYAEAQRLDPDNFLLATDIAQTYYAIQPPRTDDALKAWDTALKLAEGSLQREGVLIHLARLKLNVGRFAEARAHLNAVTNAELAELKTRVLRNLEAKEHPEAATNAAPATATNAAPPAAGSSPPPPARP